MLILIKMHNSVSWYHNPKDFSLVVNVEKTVFEIMELIGVEANSKTKVKLNGNVVSLGNLVSDGDEMEIFLVDETFVGSGSD